MRLPWSARSLLIPGLVLYLTVLALVHTLVTHNVHIVWTGVGTGTALLGVAAIITVAIKAREYIDKTNELVETTDELVETVNGGLAAAAKTHLQDNELFKSMAVRLDRVESELRDEQAAKMDCQNALTDLRQWVIDRLDGSNEGRSTPRED